MKKLILAVAVAVAGLLAGCASHENGAGGTSDQYNSSSGQYNNSNDNPTKGTGTPMTTNMNQNGSAQ